MANYGVFREVGWVFPSHVRGRRFASCLDHHAYGPGFLQFFLSSSFNRINCTRHP